jgi:hypothetical protein
LLIVAVVAGCGSGAGRPGIHVRDGAGRLTSLLRAHGVRVSAHSAIASRPLRVAWRAFKEFASVPVRASELSDEPDPDALLFEYSRGSLPGNFQMDFVRQLATSDGDFQQVHLGVEFAPAASAKIRQQLP